MATIQNPYLVGPHELMRTDVTTSDEKVVRIAVTELMAVLRMICFGCATVGTLLSLMSKFLEKVPRARVVASKVLTRLSEMPERIRRGSEEDKATKYWGDLKTYHLSNDDDPIAIKRSEWVANEVLPPLPATSLLEIGCNSGRNLFYVQRAHPSMRLRGIDVNVDAINFARSSKAGIEFLVSDANKWSEPPNSWDCALTMSVLDHIPTESTKELAASLATSCRAVLSVELWDGEPGERALYKYSTDSKSIYESVGFHTKLWCPVPRELQYDEAKSTLWVYLGSRA